MDGSIETQLRGANERVRELDSTFRCHHDARGFFVTSTLEFSIDDTATNGVKAQATIVEPQRTVVEALTLTYEVWEQMKLPHNPIQRFYSDRHLRGLSLDIAPPFTEAQRAHLERDRHNRKVGAERQNEAMRRQLDGLMRQSGLDNVPTLRRLFRK